MSSHRYASSSAHEGGIEVNRDGEGLQWKGISAAQPVIEHEANHHVSTTPYVLPGNHSGLEKKDAASGFRNPWGLTPLTFGLLIASITAIVVGAAVGGGVGGTLSCSHRPDVSCSQTPNSTTTMTTTVSTPIPTSTSTSTTNLTNYLAALPQNVRTLAWDCPNLSTFTTNNLLQNQAFVVTCGIDYNSNRAAVQGGIVSDVVGILAYSAQDCMEACSNLNAFGATWGFPTKCAGITFSQAMSSLWASFGANCWLKNGTAVNPISCDSCLSAVVQT